MSTALLRKAPLPQAGSMILIAFNLISNSSNLLYFSYSLIKSCIVFDFPLMLKYGMMVFLQI